MTMWLVIVNAIAFLLQMMLRSGSPTIYDYLPLSVQGISHGYVWQLLTFQFMHANVLHLLFNCWAIYMFGREVEDGVGKKSFLILYFSSGVIGGFLQVVIAKILALMTPAHASTLLLTQVVGASAGAFGLISAFAMLYPERPLMLLLFFIIPVNMRAKFLLLFEGLIALFGMTVGGGNVAHAAHLGGMITGIVFVRYAIHWHWPQFYRTNRQPLHPLVKVTSQKSALWSRAKSSAPEDLPAEEFLAREVDPILEKISAQGIQSLTERERRILEAARQKMAKR